MKSKFRPLVSAVFEVLRNPVQFVKSRGLFTYGMQLQPYQQQQMPAHSAVASHTDAIYSISANLPATYDAAGYAATAVVWTVIGKVSDFIPYGSKRNVNEFVPITGPVEFLKGAPRYGEGDLMMGDLPADAGQVILKAAEASQNHYSIKIQYPDSEIHYLDVIVSAWRLSPGKEGAPMVRTATLNVCRAPVVVAAT